MLQDEDGDPLMCNLELTKRPRSVDTAFLSPRVAFVRWSERVRIVAAKLAAQWENGKFYHEKAI